VYCFEYNGNRAKQAMDVRVVVVEHRYTRWVSWRAPRAACSFSAFPILSEECQSCQVSFFN